MHTATRIHNVADARRLARRALPRAMFDYIDGGAEDEVTMAENERAFREIALRPRMMTKIDRPRLDTTVLGTPVALPVLLGPCGLIQLMHGDGALGAARAARRAGTVSVLSTVAGTPPEALASEPGPRWFQLYAADRDVADQLMSRASASGFEGLVVTVDTPALGNRERDVRNGVAGSLQLNLRSAIRLGPQFLARPGWSLRMLRGGMKLLGRAPGTPVIDGGTGRDALEGTPGGPVNALASAERVVMLASPFTGDDIAWIRGRWSGPLIVKGVLSGNDALLAADLGADAVVVSNHGGRQLEGAPATMRVLGEVVDAVGGRTEVLVDSGVRRGSDVIKALAMGARAVMIGRPFLYGLAAAGEAGVERILEVFTDEMTRTLSLLGCPGVTDLDRSWLRGG